MPLFAVLNTEDVVQESDKTRLDGSQSYAAGVSAITATTIKPGKNASTITVTDTGYLDWQFDFTVDVDTENNKLDFNEGGSELTATLVSGNYTLAALAAEIQTRLRAAGALAYVVTLTADNALVISAPSGFALLAATGSHLSTSFFAEAGFTTDQTGKITYTGANIERVLKKVTLSVTNGTTTATSSKYLPVVSAHADKLFSTDDMLRRHENDIMKFLPEGRATFKDVHRRAQGLILDWLDTEGFIDDFGYKITLKRIKDIQEVMEWATMMALRLIFESVITASDDVFSIKAKKYNALEDFYRARAVLRVDINEDDTVTLGEHLDIRSCVVVRR